MTSVIGPDEGEALWMLNTLMTVKATAEDTDGRFSLLEQVLTPAGNPPLHVHRDEDEAFYVLEGEVDLIVGDDRLPCAAGTFALAPKGIPHTYVVRSPTARLLVLGAPAGVDRFFREVAQPAAARVVPDPAAPDIDEVNRVAARHGIELVGPPAT